MSYEVLNKNNVERVDGQVISTTIDIRQTNPYTVISRKIDGDHRSTNDSKAIELVLQVVNDETTPKTELVRTVKELREQVEQQQEIIRQSVESNAVLSGAFEELSFMVLEEVLPQLQEYEVVLDTEKLVEAMKIEDVARPIEQEDTPMDDEEEEVAE